MSRKTIATPGDTYPLKLSQRRRESLLRHTRLKRAIKKKVEQAGEGTQTVLVTRNELDELNDEIGQAAVYATGPDKKRLFAVLRKVTELFGAVEDVASLAVTRASARRAAHTSGLRFQFKISLLEIKPAIWRRIQVTNDAEPLAVFLRTKRSS